MQDIISVIATLLLIAVDLTVAFLFSFMIEEILARSRRWIYLLMIITGIILLQAAVYSWLPGRTGMEIQLMDGAVTLRDGALFSNLGALLIAQGIGIGIALIKHLWSVIRKQSKFLGAAFVLELLFLVLFIAAGASLFKEQPSAGETVSSGILIGLAAAGAVLLTAGIRAMKGRKTQQAAKAGE